MLEGDRAAGPVGPSRRDARAALLAGAIVAIAGGGIVFASLRAQLISDFPAHMALTAKALRGGPWPGEFLFFLANAVFAGFSTDLGTLERSLTIVVGLALGAKVWLSVRFLAAERRAGLPAAAPGSLPVWAAVVAVLCAFAFSLPVGQNSYLGQIPPNVWHNSTTIVAMPFAFALFWTSLRFLQSASTRWLWWSLALVVANLGAKPSFVLAFLPAFLVLALVRFGTTLPLWRAALLLVVVVALLALQSLYVYAVDPSTAQGSGVAIRPLRVWRIFSEDIPLSLLASCVFPLFALTFGGAALRAGLAVRYAAMLLICALAEFALLAERGPRELNGNFSWQTFISMWVLFVVLMSALRPMYERRPIGVRQLAIATAFLVQVAAGGLFLHEWFATKSFY
jgi:hypothetical protein